MKKTENSLLGAAGAALSAELEAIYDLDDSQPLLVRLCLVADRLEQLRAKIAQADLTTVEASRLLQAEARAQGSYARFWKLLGLSDQPPTGPGRTGRPAGRR